MIIPLTSALVEGIGFNLQKRGQKNPYGEISPGTDHLQSVQSQSSDFQNSRGKHLSNLILTSKVDLHCVGRWPGQALRSQPDSYNFYVLLFLEQAL